ncbi:MAG: hypothetical protein KGH78_05165 [Candidatus Micrarchaeota archaeon]|nr:hypothetical protein [Candidatus Micrarchaeota archaeon]MDE1847262.1 hypothetical protein [Candidatus Micrarchaeota archaeon]
MEGEVKVNLAKMLPRLQPILVEIASVTNANLCSMGEPYLTTMHAYYFGITKKDIAKAESPKDIFASGFYYTDLDKFHYEIDSGYHTGLFKTRTFLFGKLVAKELLSVAISTMSDASPSRYGRSSWRDADEEFGTKRVNIFTDIDNIAHIMLKHSHGGPFAAIALFEKLKIDPPEELRKEAEQKSMELLQDISRELISAKDGKLPPAATNLLIMAQRAGVEKYVTEIEPHPGIKIDVKEMLKGMQRGQESAQKKFIKA